MVLIVGYRRIACEIDSDDDTRRCEALQDQNRERPVTREEVCEDVARQKSEADILGKQWLAIT
jgi:hypothetical protein